MTTDWYGLCEDAVVNLLKEKLPATIIKAATKDKQVTKSDADVLGMGHDYLAVTYPGEFPTTDFAAQIVEVDWEVGLDIFSRCNAGEAANWQSFKTYRAEIFQLFVSYRTLNRVARIKKVALRSGGAPEYVTSKGNPDSAPVYITQPLVVTVKQQINRTGGEYPDSP